MRIRLAAAALVFLCAGCSRPEAARTPAAPATHSLAASALGTPASAAAMPADQANLLKLIADVDANPKDEAAFNRFCTTLEATPAFKDWTGTVSDVQTSTVDGAIDITFTMGKHLKFEPVVQKSDPVYPAVEALTEGQGVTLSGRFSHNAGSSECTYYLSSFAVSLTRADPR